MRWRALEPPDAAALLRGFEGTWWVAGGWAVDLFLGRTTREHADLDVAFRRDEQELVRRHLDGWDLQIADRGELRPWSGERLELPLHQLWARPAGAEEWHLELLLLETWGSRWVFRRDPRVTLSLERAGLVRGGIPFLAPEIALLFKAKQPRATDDADLAAVLPHLPDARRRWLAAAVRVQDPAHAWLPALECK